MLPGRLSELRFGSRKLQVDFQVCAPLPGAVQGRALPAGVVRDLWPWHLWEMRFPGSPPGFPTEKHTVGSHVHAHVCTSADPSALPRVLRKGRVLSLCRKDPTVVSGVSVT